jgi:cytochrome c-type biogenesis protein CcmH
VILFWVICAAMILIALLFVLPPVLQHSEESALKAEEARKQANIAVYRDQLTELKADLRNGLVSEEHYAQDREEIERRLLEDTMRTENTAAVAPSVLMRALMFGLYSPFMAIVYFFRSKKTAPAPISPRSTAFGLGVILPLVAIIFYMKVGEPQRIENPAPVGVPSAAAPAPAERSQAQIEANIAKLAERLASNPNDLQGWTMLARSYSSMEKYGEAAKAYEKATELSPKDADLLAEYAFSMAMSEGRSLAGKPMEIINRALKIDPNNAKVLQLAGSAAFEAKNYKKAVDYWERVLKQVPPNSEVSQAITERINEAKSLSGSK